MCTMRYMLDFWNDVPFLFRFAVGFFFGAAMSSWAGVIAERGLAGSARGRSHCICGRQLSDWENIPVISWLLLRGRCRCKKVSIPVRYVLTESAGGICSGFMFVVGIVAGILFLPVLVVSVVLFSRVLGSAGETQCIPDQRSDAVECDQTNCCSNSV